MRPRWSARLVAAALVLFGAVALEQAFEAVSALALVRAPSSRRFLGPTEAGERRIAVGPPPATLSAIVLEPRLPPRATIFVLHGIRDQKDYLRHIGVQLAAAGYRAVLVDSRGHGRSTGQYLTWGLVERRDLSQVLDALAIDGPVGVFGESYGAAVAILWAADEPRVKAVVALAPFSSLREEIPAWWRLYVPVVGRLVPDWIVQRSIDRAGRLASFDPDRASPRDAVRHTRTPILLVHGRADHTVPFSAAEEIVAAAPDHVRLVAFDGDHETISADPRLMPLTLDFFESVIK